MTRRSRTRPAPWQGGDGGRAKLPSLASVQLRAKKVLASTSASVPNVPKGFVRIPVSAWMPTARARVRDGLIKEWTQREHDRILPALTKYYADHPDQQVELEALDSQFVVDGNQEPLVQWARRNIPGAFSRYEPAMPVAEAVGSVEPIQDLRQLPVRLYHGSRALHQVLTEGFRIKPAGRVAHEVYAWEAMPRTDTIDWSRWTWDWWKSLKAEQRRHLERQVGHPIRSKRDLGESVSLLWTDEYVDEASGYTSGGDPIAEIDPLQLAIYGWYEADEAGRKGENVLVLSSVAPQGPPSAVTGLIVPDGHPVLGRRNPASEVVDETITVAEVDRSMRRESQSGYETRTVTTSRDNRKGKPYIVRMTTLWKDGRPIGYFHRRRDGKIQFTNNSGYGWTVDESDPPRSIERASRKKNPGRSQSSFAVEKQVESTCVVDDHVGQLAAEIVGIGYNHPVAAAFSAIHDAGKMHRGHPVFNYGAMLVDAIDTSTKVLSDYHDGKITERAALSMLERRHKSLTDPVPKDVAEAMEGYVLSAANPDLLQATIEVLFERIEQIVSHNTRMAMYVYVEEFDPEGREMDNPIRDYLEALDAQVADAEKVRGQLRMKEIDDYAAARELLKIRDYVLGPSEDIQIKVKDKPASIFEAYNEISTTAELSKASRKTRAGIASDEQKQVAEYLDALVKQAGEIRELHRVRMVNFDIALMALRKMAEDARRMAPDASKAGEKLPKPVTLPKLHDPASLDALAEIEGQAWRSHQDAHRDDPKGFWANHKAMVVLRGMGSKSKGLMVSQLVAGGGIIEGQINDYIVGSDGRLTKRSRSRS